jgi:hypothetical protein
MRKLQLGLVLSLCVVAISGCGGGSGAAPPLASTAASSLAPPPSLSARRAVILSTDTGSSKHVKTWGYWGQPTEPAGVSAAYIASQLTFLEADPTHVSQFRNAGGTYTVKYTDPSRVIPANHEPLYTVPESGWFHDSSGRRISLSYPGFGVQNMLNPEMAVTRSAYTTYTQQVAASGPYNYVEVDNTYYDLAGAFYGFSAAGVEAGSQSAYDNGVIALLDGSAITPIINGLSNADGFPNGPSGTTTFLSHAAGGIDNEGCLQSTYVKSLGQWQFDENTLLYTSKQGKWSVCWGTSAQTRDAHVERLFYLASVWLTYDPTYTVAFAQFASGHGLFVFPEYGIVPLSPVQSPASNISELQDGTGAYVREFRSCSQNGVSIGTCAAFVNPTGSTVSTPARARNYGSALVLDSNNAFDGGQAAWGSNTATTIAPHTALIVKGGTGGATPPPPAPTPPPAGGGSLTVTGTIQTVSANSLLLASSCGYLYASYSSSTPITANGFSLAAGTTVSVTGTGSCSTSIAATKITLTGVASVSISGTVLSVNPTYLVVQTSGACGKATVDYGSGTKFSGTSLRNGATVSVSGTGSCSTAINAMTIAVQ